MKKEDIIKEINSRYRIKKMQKNPYMAPEQIPDTIQSDQVKSAIEVFSEMLEKLTEKKKRVIQIDWKNEKDLDFAKKFIELYEKMTEEN